MGNYSRKHFIKKHPEEVEYYIGVGQVIDMFENEKFGYEKVKELALKANDQKSLKQLESLGNYPGEDYGIRFKKKSEKLRLIQGKYGLAVNWNISMIIKLLKSPTFKVSDIYALMKMDKVNENIIDFWSRFNLRSESLEYKVPIYYILGENDWQTPYVIAEEYFQKIKAPTKKIFVIPNAGHMTMVDQPNLFFEALSEIKGIE